MDSSRSVAGATLAKKPSTMLCDDVFGGPPRFSKPFAARVNEYADIFGGFVSSCSIPFLDLPVATGGYDDVGKFDYAEVFGGLDFGQFGVPYEEMVKRAVEEEDEDEIWAEDERAEKEASYGQQPEERFFEEVNLEDDDEFASTSRGSENNMIQLDNSTEEKGRCLEVDETCETVVNSNSTNDINDVEETAITETEGNENSPTIVDGTTCELCNYSRKLTVSGTTILPDKNECEFPDQTASYFFAPAFSEEKVKFDFADTNESRGAREQEQDETTVLEKINFMLEDNEIQTEMNQETGCILDDLENKGQGLAQQFEEKPIVEATFSLHETSNERIIEGLQQNFNNDTSYQIDSTMGNSEEQKVEFHNLDKTASVDTIPEVEQGPTDGQLDILQTAWYERTGSIFNSTVDIKENCFASNRATANIKTMEVEQQERRFEKERELCEGERRSEENKEWDKEWERETERKRQREKDRIAVERATREVQERAFAEAKEKAERIAVERVTADFRQRALKEAREKVEKASAEALERSLAEKAQREARLRAERAAVERATREARERAVEKALAEKAVMDAKERTGRYATSKDRMRKESVANEHVKAETKDRPQVQFQNSSFSGSSQGNGESDLRYKAWMERDQRAADRAARAVAEMNIRDIIARREQAERNRSADYLDAEVKKWSKGKGGNLRYLLSTLQHILGPDSGWQPIPLTEMATAAAVKKAYRKATLSVHPDKLQQRGASIQQKYICEKVFDVLKEAWDKFNLEVR